MLRWDMDVRPYFDPQPYCKECESKCGFADQPAAINYGTFWLCKPCDYRYIAKHRKKHGYLDIE